MQGVAILESTKTLGPESPGFRTAAEIFKDLIPPAHPDTPSDEIRVIRFQLASGATFTFDVRGSTSVTRGLTVSLSNRKNLDWSVEALVTALQYIRQERLTMAAIGIFSLGILLQIIGFVIEASKNPTTATSTSK